jgi:diguanylate cyclase (GGDEF)-like protein/PAS domain S-box-containing protein
VAAGAVAVFAVLTAVHTGASSGWVAFENAGEVLAAVLATIACAVRLRREHLQLLRARAGERSAGEIALQRQMRLAWALLFAGVALWMLGAVGWFVYEVVLGLSAPEPSVMDGASLLGYLFVAGGLLAMVRTAAGHLSHVRGAVEALFIGCGFLLCIWSLVIGPVFGSSYTATLAGVVDLAYPLLDALVLAGVFYVSLKRRDDLPAGLIVLAGGIVAWAVTDALNWYLTEAGGGVPTVSLLDSGWFAGYLLIAFGALRRPSPVRHHRRGARGHRLLVVLPALPTALGIAIVLSSELLHGHVQSATVVVWIMAVSIALGGVLQIIDRLENHALTSDLEHRVQSRTAQLHSTESYYRALVHNASDAVMVLGPDLTIRYASDSSETVLGHAPSELIDSHLEVFGANAAATLTEALMRVGHDPDQTARVEWELTDASGRSRRAESTITNLLHDHDVDGFVLNTRDDTDRAALAEQLRNQAFHDPLTGLPNRALLGDRASQAFARSLRSNASIAVMAVDVDTFKLVNDSFGHKTGDLLLCAVAQRLQATVRPEDTVARLGGDEFVVLMDPVPDADAAEALAERIREALMQDIAIGENTHNITASVGIAVGCAPNSNFDQLLCDADLALYAVKGAGRDAVQLYEPSMSQNASSRFKKQSELRKAIVHEEFCLYYQPEVSTETHELQGFEALVRWNHPDGVMPPDTFIPLAEETGLIVPLGRWVLKAALHQAAEWTHRKDHAPELSISVNVSAVQLKSPGILADVQSAISESGIDPARVVIEVTESSFIDNSQRVLDTLYALKELGVRLAIDDFGTGYASVSNLQHMPFDILKIDKSFLAQVDDGQHGNEMLEAIVNIGRVLELQTIAEGIEHHGQLNSANDLGCDLAQGYLLGRPLPPEHVQDMIREHASPTSA